MKRFQKTHLWLVLATIAFTAVPAHAQLVFQFDQQGVNTVVTGSGTGMTLAAGANGHAVGFYAGPLAGGPLLSVGAAPAGWIPSVITQNIVAVPIGLPTLAIGGVAMDRMQYVSASNPPFPDRLLLFNLAAVNVPALTSVAASGTATFANPFTSLFADHAPGTVLQVFPGLLHFIIGVVPTGGGGGGSTTGGGGDSAPDISSPRPGCHRFFGG